MSDGSVDGPIVIENVNGSRDNPVVIESADPQRPAIINARGAPGKSGRQAIVIRNSRGILIRNLHFKNANRSVITVQDSSYITVRGNKVDRTGRYLVHTTSPKSHHIVIERNHLTQRRAVYDTWDWADLHHNGSCGATGLRNSVCCARAAARGRGCMDDHGAIYGGRGAGAVVIRDNFVNYAFDAVQANATARDAQQAKYQANFEVYRNTFNHIRDNAIDLNRYAFNWHVYHNTFNNVVNGVVDFGNNADRGGDISVYGNSGGFYDTSNPDGDPWAIWKFSDYLRGGFDYGVRIYNNAFYYFGALGGTAGRYRNAANNVDHRNNAYEHQAGSVGVIDWAAASNGRFDHDCTSALRFPPYMTDDRGWESAGVEDVSRVFVNPEVGHQNFRLANSGGGNPCRNRGATLGSAHLYYWQPESQRTGAMDIGRYEGNQEIYLWPFRQKTPPAGKSPYVEHPRIVRIFRKGRVLAMFFSANIDAKTVNANAIELRDEHGVRVPVRSAQVVASVPRVVRLALGRNLHANKSIRVAFKGNVRSTHGRVATLWGADLKLVHVHRNMRLLPRFAAVFRG